MLFSVSIHFENQHLLVAVWTCVDMEYSKCFTNRTWMNAIVSPSRALMSRQYCSIDYRRMDGYFRNSSPVTDPIPIPFDIQGMFQLYKLSYGVANLSDSSNITDAIKNEIRYQTVEQTTSFLRTEEVAPIERTPGDRFSGSAAVQAFILPLIMDYVDTMTADCLTWGSSMAK